MTKKIASKKRGPGRPRTGITKEIIKASVDKEIAALGRKTAMATGESFSRFVSRAIHAAIIKAS
jgi:hypothetical protein